MKFICFALLLVVLNPQTLLAQNADVQGTWNVLRGEGHRLSTLTLKQSGDRVVGTWSPQGEAASAIREGAIHAGVLRCSVFRHDHYFDIVGTVHGSAMNLDIRQRGNQQVVHATARRQTKRPPTK